MINKHCQIDITRNTRRQHLWIYDLMALYKSIIIIIIIIISTPLIFLKKRFSGLQNLNTSPANNSLQKQHFTWKANNSQAYYEDYKIQCCSYSTHCSVFV